MSKRNTSTVVDSATITDPSATAPASEASATAPASEASATAPASDLPSFGAVRHTDPRGQWDRDAAINAAKAAMRTREQSRGVRDTSALAYASAAARKLNEAKRTTHDGQPYYTGPAVLALLGITR